MKAWQQMTWPPQSPDLSIIESDYIKRQKTLKHYRSTGLWQILQDAPTAFLPSTMKICNRIEDNWSLVSVLQWGALTFYTVLHVRSLKKYGIRVMSEPGADQYKAYLHNLQKTCSSVDITAETQSEFLGAAFEGFIMTIYHTVTTITVTHNWSHDWIPSEAYQIYYVCLNTYQITPPQSGDSQLYRVSLLCYIKYYIQRSVQE